MEAVRTRAYDDLGHVVPVHVRPVDAVVAPVRPEHEPAPRVHRQGHAEVAAARRRAVGEVGAVHAGVQQTLPVREAERTVAVDLGDVDLCGRGRPVDGVAHPVKSDVADDVGSVGVLLNHRVVHVEGAAPAEAQTLDGVDPGIDPIDATVSVVIGDGADVGVVAPGDWDAQLPMVAAARRRQRDGGQRVAAHVDEVIREALRGTEDLVGFEAVLVPAAARVSFHPPVAFAPPVVGPRRAGAGYGVHIHVRGIWVTHACPTPHELTLVPKVTFVVTDMAAAVPHGYFAVELAPVETEGVGAAPLEDRLLPQQTVLVAVVAG